MFDIDFNQTHDCGLNRARCFFADHGHQLATVAALLGGAAAEARVVSCAIRLERSTRLDRQLRQDLKTLLRLLTLQNISDPDYPDGDFLPFLDPASQEVEMICLLTDALQDLLLEINDTPSHVSHDTRPSAA